MIEPDPEMRGDGSFLRQIDEVVSALYSHHVKLVEHSAKAGYGTYLEGRLSQFLAESPFFAPIILLPKEVPVPDIETDLQDFGALAILTENMRWPIPALRVNSQSHAIPILFPQPIIETAMWLSSRDPEAGQYLIRQLLADFGAGHVIDLSWKEAQGSFFGGLGSFLAARVLGVRWLNQSQRSIKGLSGGRGGPPGIGGSGGGTSVGQMWTVHTSGGGLSLSYHGTHAARIPTALPGGVTTPVTVFLPTGTLYLGANAGPGGTVLWDSTILTVPNSLPTYHTTTF